MQIEPNASHEFSHELLDRISGGLLVLEPDLRVRCANRSFCEMIRVAPADIEGAPFQELCGGQWDRPTFWQNLTRLRNGTADNVDFEIDIEIPPSGARVFRLHGEPLDDLPRILFEVRDMTAEHRIRHEPNSLVAELYRRLKRLIGTVPADASASRYGGRTLEEREIAYLQRLAALDRTHTMIADSDIFLASVDDIVRTGIGIYHRRNGNRITVGGEPVRLPVREAETLTLVVHELSTNALRHGALSGSGGCVDVFWQADARGGRKHFFMEWRETGVAHAPPDEEKDDGLDLIEYSLGMLGGTADFHSDADGITCSVCFPFSGGIAHIPAS